MGMYTAISLGVKLNIEQNGAVAQLLSYMVGESNYQPVLSADEKEEADMYHPFFSCSRWDFMLRCDSYYFDYQTNWSFEWDNTSNNYYLSGVSNLKNYSGEIKQFLDWLNPYIHASSAGFIGWTMYEAACMPTILVRRRLVEGEDYEIFPLSVEMLTSLVVDCDAVIEELMPGAGNCVVNISKLNDILMATSALKRNLT